MPLRFSLFISALFEKVWKLIKSKTFFFHYAIIFMKKERRRNKIFVEGTSSGRQMWMKGIMTHLI